MKAESKDPPAERETGGKSTSYPFQPVNKAAERRIALLYEALLRGDANPLAALQSALKNVSAFSVGPAEEIDRLELTTGQAASGKAS